MECVVRELHFEGHHLCKLHETQGRLPPHSHLRGYGFFLVQRPKLHIAIAIASTDHRFFATCAPGLEPIVAAELSSPPIAASNILLGSSGVSFSGSLVTALNANLWLRCAIRVLAHLASSPLPPRRARHADAVYEFVRDAADWPTLLVKDGDNASLELEAPSQEGNAAMSRDFDGLPAKRKTVTRRRGSRRWSFRSFAVQSRMRDCTQVNNSMFASIRAKDAICDSIREACGGCKPDPPEDGGATADVPLFLSLFKDHASIYRDMSGISLHRRGYRDVMHRASLNEAIAAGVLTIAGWNERISGFGAVNQTTLSKDWCLLDPMCGSGTLLIEAALMACNKAPGLMRSHWPFQTWHDFDEDLWKECQNVAGAAEICPPGGLKLLGNDIHQGALSLCIKDAKSAGVHDLLELCCKDCEEYKPPAQPSLVVVNPPWGARLGVTSNEELEDVLPVWRGLGQFLKQRCNCADVYVLSGNPSATKGLRMKTDKKWPITVGGVECKLLHYYVLPQKMNELCNFMEEK